MSISCWKIKHELASTWAHKMQNVIYDQLDIFIVSSNLINSPRELLLDGWVPNNFSLHYSSFSQKESVPET